MFPSCRNQLLDLLCKSGDWCLCVWTLVIKGLINYTNVWRCKRKIYLKIRLPLKGFADNLDCVFDVNAFTDTAWKVSIFGVILVRIFPHFGLLSESGKIRTRTTLNTGTFYAVLDKELFQGIDRQSLIETRIPFSYELNNLNSVHILMWSNLFSV